ncbi:MAG: hypothetical protein KC505_05865 [Myxococcales bacterium]|nr:hypothetical protein [Myxococcales bacterium]USN50103.1 MAG: hypothetical protein H6731_07470 [Myxococcales bacterium]
MLVTAYSMQAYFREALEAAIRNSNTQMTESAQAYIVHLLNEFCRSEVVFAGTDYGAKPNMAQLLERALLAQDGEAQRIFRHLGDTSLYLLGFFQESTVQRIVSQSYYRDMGSQAYLHASTMAKAHSAHTAALFYELSERFDDIVKVVEIISRYNKNSEEN